MHIQGFTPVPSLVGGALIGLAATLLWLGNGKLAGISGLVAGALRPAAADWVVRVAFIAGLVASGLVVARFAPHAIAASPRTLPLLAISGVLVGFGARLGGGCTSGHGVCGLSRLSKRSLFATLTFMGAAAIAVFALSHLGGGT
jgi:uncharacterized membrane protein YedE/YeeE